MALVSPPGTILEYILVKDGQIMDRKVVSTDKIGNRPADYIKRWWSAEIDLGARAYLKIKDDRDERKIDDLH